MPCEKRSPRKVSSRKYEVRSMKDEELTLLFHPSTFHQISVHYKIEAFDFVELGNHLVLVVVAVFFQ